MEMNGGGWAVQCATYDEIIAFINSLPEEPVSEDLKEAAKEHCYDKQYDATEIIDGENDFIAGAKWNRERIINKACEWLKDELERHSVHASDIEHGCERFKEYMTLDM